VKLFNKYDNQARKTYNFYKSINQTNHTDKELILYLSGSESLKVKKLNGNQKQFHRITDFPAHFLAGRSFYLSSVATKERTVIRFCISSQPSGSDRT